MPQYGCFIHAAFSRNLLVQYCILVQETSSGEVGCHTGGKLQQE